MGLSKKSKSNNRRERKEKAQRSQGSNSYRNENNGFPFASFAKTLRTLRLKRLFEQPHVFKKYIMRTNILKFWITLIFFLSLNLIAKSQDSTKFVVSTNYYKDLSDTYGGGSLCTGEFFIIRSWYGGCISYGHFQSQSPFNFKVIVDEINETVQVPFKEMAIMQTGAISGFLRPVQKEWINFDILFGFVIGKAKSLIFKNLDFDYSFTEHKFIYLYQDYQLIKTSHLGYQFGFNVTFYPTKKVGLQVNSRLMDLSNGGTFFFVGGGLCFRL